MNGERIAFENWLGIKPCGAAHDLAWAAWKARAYLPAPQQATPEPVGEPWGWAVNSTLFRGEFAEADAKAEAKRCGGTTRAVALYTAPPAPAEPMTREQAMAIVQSNPDTMTAIRMTEAHHGITDKGGA